MVTLTPIPDAPAWLPGLINLRGRTTPIIDLRGRLGLPPRPPRLSTRIVIAQTDTLVIGLIADMVNQVATLPNTEIEKTTVSSELSNLVAGVARLEGRLILILNLESLAADAAKFSVG